MRETLAAGLISLPGWMHPTPCRRENCHHCSTHLHHSSSNPKQIHYAFSVATQFKVTPVRKINTREVCYWIARMSGRQAQQQQHRESKYKKVLRVEHSVSDNEITLLHHCEILSCCIFVEANKGCYCTITWTVRTPFACRLDHYSAIPRVRVAKVFASAFSVV
jgi:hypothetical protein